MDCGREAMWMEGGELVSRWRQSGFSIAESCRREDIAYWKILSWRKRLAELDASAGGFAELLVGGEECVTARP